MDLSWLVLSPLSVGGENTLFPLSTISPLFVLFASYFPFVPLFATLLHPFFTFCLHLPLWITLSKGSRASNNINQLLL